MDFASPRQQQTAKANKKKSALIVSDDVTFANHFLYFME